MGIFGLRRTAGAWGWGDSDGNGMVLHSTAVQFDKMDVACWWRARSDREDSSPAALVGPRAEAEVAPLFESDLQSTVFSEDEIAAYSGADFGSLTRVEMQVDHMNVLAQRARLLSAQPDLGVRAEMISGSLERALCLFDEIDQSGILLEPAYRKRVQSYRDGFSIFTDEI